MKRSCSAVLGLALVLPVLGCGGSEVGVVRNRLNIVLIMADGMGYSDIGSSGSGIRTPNLDRFADERPELAAELAAAWGEWADTVGVWPKWTGDEG